MTLFLICLPTGGFLYVDDLLQLEQFHRFTQADVESVVQTNDKQRFTLETDAESGKLKIRANQGHSIDVGWWLAEKILGHSVLLVYL